mgnify:CR=1 FL=1
MLGKNRKYKNLDFSDVFQKKHQKENGRSYPLQDKYDDMISRTEEFANANYHGGILSHSLYGIRYINFLGVGIGVSKEERAKVLRVLQEELSLPHGNGNQEYFDLFRETDDGGKRTCKAKISQALSTRHQLWNYKFDYTFQLACPSEKIYGLETRIKRMSRGFLGGVPLGSPLATEIWSFGGVEIVTNEGNRYAPIRIQLIWTCTNPKIINLTTGEIIRIQAVTQNLIFDNRNIDFSQARAWKLEDLGQDISAKRLTGKDLYLSPGKNKIVITTDIPEENPEIILTRRDTFNY